MPKRNGIDVSHYQGVIDWGKVAGSGVVWAATKATQGTTFVDKTLSRNRAGMAEQRIKHRLFYHWLNPAPLLVRMSSTARIADARKQAAHFVATVGRLLPGEGVMLDAEQDGIRADQALAWCQYVEAAFGRPVAVYTGAYVAKGEIWKSAAIYNGQRPRVFAAYSSEERAKAHAAPHRWDVWQWTGTGRMPGVNGDVDIDQVDNAGIFDAVCGIHAIPQPPEVTTPTPEASTMGKRFKADDGDVAEFCVVGGIAKWIKDPAHRNFLRFAGQLDNEPANLIARADLKKFSLVGPQPVYPAGYTGPVTSASSFA